MPQLNINHAFVSPKVDSPDGSLVSSSEWNAGLVGTGGAHNQLVVRDGGSPTGLSLVQGPMTSYATSNYTGAGPTTALSTTTLNFSTTSFVLVMATVIAVVTDSSNATVFLQRNGVVVLQYVIHGTGIMSSITFPSIELPGAATFRVFASLGSGTFTNCFSTIGTFTIGTL